MSNDFSTDVGKRCPDCGLVFATGLPHRCRDANVTADQSEKAAALAKESVAADTSDLVGVVLGERYKIIKPLGKGGMGVVYQARHTLLNSLLAVKILLYAQDEEAKSRFLREARIASQIQHPNTVFISDYGLLPDGRPYIVMEFLQGPTLRDLLERGAMDPLRACLIGAQITRGLQTVHEKGIVHRDPCAPSSGGVQMFRNIEPSDGCLLERRGGIRSSSAKRRTHGLLPVAVAATGLRSNT